MTSEKKDGGAPKIVLELGLATDGQGNQLPSCGIASYFQREDDIMGEIEVHGDDAPQVEERIVTACNAHDDLVAALEAARDALNGAPNTVGLHSQIDAALSRAKATGGE